MQTQQIANHPQKQNKGIAESFSKAEHARGEKNALSIIISKMKMKEDEDQKEEEKENI